jgi:hypothetical protein
MEINNAGTECITEEEAREEDQQRSELGDPSIQETGAMVLALFLLEGDKSINEMPGWFLLTSQERKDMLNLLEQLGLAVDRSQLTVDSGPEMTTDEQYMRIMEKEARIKWVRWQAIIKAEEIYKDRQEAHRILIEEIGGRHALGQYIVKIPEYIEWFFKSPRELAFEYVEGKLTDTVVEEIQKKTHGGSPATFEAAALELVSRIPYLATKGTVIDYYNYKEIFKGKCGDGCEGEKALKFHYEALAEMRQNINKPGQLNWAEDGEAYDRAFRRLSDKLPEIKENQ